MVREATMKIDAAEIERILIMHFSAQRINVEAVTWRVEEVTQRGGPEFTGCTMTVKVGD